MKTLLQINSSVFGDNGQSSQLNQQLVQEWLDKNPEGKVVKRDLTQDVIPHLDSTRVSAFFTPADKRSAEQQTIVDYSDALINEIQQTDAIVIGAPMYNFSIPSQLKSYLDHLARAGVTFKYTKAGPIGLLDNKPVYIVTTRGGVHKNLPSDSLTGFLKTFLNFIGLNDLHFIYAEGLSISQKKDESLLDAKKVIHEEIAA
jgi:FMN-dependent NADH-azoreductase